MTGSGRIGIRDARETDVATEPDGDARKDAALEALLRTLPEPDEDELVADKPSRDLPPEEHRPPPETIWGSI